MKGSTRHALLSLALLAAFLRLRPVAQYLYWGADFGEYFLVTRLLATGEPLPRPYEGWGVSYPEFPGMNLLVASASWAGIPLEAAAVLLIPLLASLVVVPAFLLGREVTGHDGAGLVAAAVVAVAMPHAYTTSHPIPGTLGDLLFVSALLLLVRMERDPRASALFVPVALALVPVHHLSSYFLIVSVLFLGAFRVLLGRRTPRQVRRETALLALLVAANVAYWTLVADSFRAFLGADRVPWWVTAGLLLLVPLALPALAALRQRLAWTYRPAFPRPRRTRAVLLLAAGATAAVLGLLSTATTPGTTIPVTAVALLYGAPYVGLFLLAAPGRRFFDFLPGGLVVTAPFVGLNLSWLLGGVLVPTFLIPYRHLEYLTPLLAVFAGMGAIRLASSAGERRVLAIALGTLILLGALVAIPPREAVGNHFEGIRPQALNGVHWAAGSVDGLTATDHRASSVLFGLGGVPATWDRVSDPLYAPSFDAARAEMAAPPGGGRVSYVLLDQDLIQGATLLPWDPARPLSEEALAKFEEPPYLRLYDDGYTRIYWVNWGLA